MDSLGHQFLIERSRREIAACTSADELRSIAAKMLDLLEAQREVVLRMVSQGWLKE